MSPTVADVLAVAVLLLVGNVVFRRFAEGTPLWRRVAKTVFALALVALLSTTVGRVGVVAFGAITIGALAVVHGWWLPRHGINWWTGEPREALERLRGWDPTQR